MEFLGGGSLMYWGAFGYNGKSKLTPIITRLDSAGYQDVLKANLLSEGTKMGGRGWIFQQDNAPIHASRSTKSWLAARNVRVLPWPAKSPDLNPMENLWGIMTRRVYAHGKQYDTKRELKEAIHKEWENISLETLRKLTDSMPNRIHETILKQGKFLTK